MKNAEYRATKLGAEFRIPNTERTGQIMKFMEDRRVEILAK